MEHIGAILRGYLADPERALAEGERRRGQQELVRARGTPYPDYLRSSHWRETREALLGAAAGRCQRCGRQDPHLRVHHFSYEHLGDENPRELKAVCEACHAVLHHRGGPGRG